MSGGGGLLPRFVRQFRCHESQLLREYPGGQANGILLGIRIDEFIANLNHSANRSKFQVRIQADAVEQAGRFSISRLRQ